MSTGEHAGANPVARRSPGGGSRTKVAQARPGVNLPRRRERVSPMRFWLALCFAALAASAAGTARGQSRPNSKNARTNLRIVVTGGNDNQPVANASVYLRFTETRFLRKAKKVELDLKTNHEGVAVMRDLPRAEVVIQVVATGWKSFGQRFKLDRDEQTIPIKLEKPPHWY